MARNADNRKAPAFFLVVENFDVFIAYSDDRATYGQQHARYLFNYQPSFRAGFDGGAARGRSFHRHWTGIRSAREGWVLIARTSASSMRSRTQTKSTPSAKSIGWPIL